MRTSSQNKKRGFAGVLLKVVATLAFVAVINALMTFVLVPWTSRSQLTWDAYYETEDIDTIFIGSSLAERGFDPFAYDQVLGTSSVNLATPGQWLEESYLGIAKVLRDDRGVQTVVLGIEYSRLQGINFPSPSRAFFGAMNAGDPYGSVHDTLWLLSQRRLYTEPNSINWAFPWIESHVGLSPASVADNVSHKLGLVPNDGTLEDNLDGWDYVGRGYGNKDWHMDEEHVFPGLYLGPYGRRDFTPECLAVLDDICDLCEHEGVDLVVVGMPLPVFNLYDYGDKYFELYEQLSDHLAERGVEYYDFNLANPDFFYPDHYFYADSQHLNYDGAAAFSEAFALLMRDRRSGEDPHSHFMTPDQWRQETGYIDLLSLDLTPEAGQLLAKAKAFAGPSTQVEYRFETSEDGESWQMVQDWSGSSTCHIDMPSDGESVHVRVLAREMGGSSQIEESAAEIATIRTYPPLEE